MKIIKVDSEKAEALLREIDKTLKQGQVYKISLKQLLKKLK